MLRTASGTITWWIFSCSICTCRSQTRGRPLTWRTRAFVLQRGFWFSGRGWRNGSRHEVRDCPKIQGSPYSINSWLCRTGSGDRGRLRDHSRPGDLFHLAGIFHKDEVSSVSLCRFRIAGKSVCRGSGSAGHLVGWFHSGMVYGADRGTRAGRRQTVRPHAAGVCHYVCDSVLGLVDWVHRRSVPNPGCEYVELDRISG